MNDEEPISYVASPTLAQFHASDLFVRAIKGPVGSGKSTGCVIELLRRALEQKPFRGIRKTRAIVIRNTYAELKTTTIRTFMQWMGGLGEIVFDAPIRWRAVRDLPDGTKLDFEVIFMPLDRPDDVKKLKSLEATFAWINEASEVPMDILKVLRGRVGRFPSAAEGGCSWTGIWLDTNPPSVRSDFYDLFEVQRPKNHGIWHQPGGMIRVIKDDDTVEYHPNPAAENIEYLPGGYGYYENQIHGNTEDHIKVYVLGEYGATYHGKPVFSTFDSHTHVARAALSIEPGDIVVGLDFGLNPAAVFTQMMGHGGLAVLAEIAPQDVTLEEFIAEHLVPTIHKRFARRRLIVVGDPAGVSKNAINKKSAFDMLKERGIAASPAYTNDFIPRRDAVAFFLNRRNGFVMDPECVVLRAGFAGEYRYAKLRTGDSMFKETPEKTMASHVHDALQYAALFFYREVAPHFRRRRRPAGVPANQGTPYRYA